MAEIGAAASVLQIIQLAATITLKTSILYSKFKHAPRAIKNHLCYIEGFNRILCALKATLERSDPPCLRDVISVESRAAIQRLLQRCEQEVNSCNVLLKSFLPNDEAKWKETWKRLSSIRKEEEIQTQLQYLDSLRSEVSLWYSDQLLLLTCELHLYVKTTVDSRLQSLQQQVEQGFNEHTVSIDKERQLILSDSRNNQRQDNGAQSQPSPLPIALLAEEICHRLASRPELLAKVAREDTEGKNIHNMSCQCGRMLKQKSAVDCGFIRYQHRAIESHKPGCPYFERNLEKRMELSLRVSLISRSIDITLAMSNAPGALTLYLQLLDFPIVDQRIAPCFRRFQSAEQEIRWLLWDGPIIPYQIPFRNPIPEQKLLRVRYSMESLYNGLLEDLQTTKYSARVQSDNGSTLLHAYAWILNAIWLVQDELRDIINKTVTLLAHFGVDTNAAISTSCYHNGSTALMLCLNVLEPSDVFRLGSEACIPRILSQHMMGTLWPAKHVYLQYMGVLAKAPDLALDYGCSRLSIAVIERNQPEVERLIQKGHDVNDTFSPPFSPLCFAVGWNAGAKLLLRAGADPSAAIHCAIAYEDESTLRDILHSGSRLFTARSPSRIQGLWSYNWIFESVLRFALWCQWAQESTPPTFVQLITEAVADSRQKLMDLSQKYMSLHELKRCGWIDPSNQGLVSDAVAMVLARSLLERKISVPEGLWPSKKRSIYHEEWMTAAAADDLFQAGFQAVDLLDEKSQTPLLLNAHFSRWLRDRPIREFNLQQRTACMYWFLQHGAERVVFPEVNGTSVAHVIGANLGNVWTLELPGEDVCWAKDNQELCQQAVLHLPLVLDRVFSLISASQRDNCQCFCSEDGCLPVHALLSHMKPRYFCPARPTTLWATWKDEQDLLRLWRICAASNPLKELEFSEICRYQIFNRLGMRHTCCTFWRSESRRTLRPKIQTMEESEKNEIWEEDTYAKSQLDAFMILYQKLNTKYHDRFTKFWDTWWDVLEEYLPSVNWTNPLSNRGLRHVQIHDDLVPIEEHELHPRLDQIKKRITTVMESTLQDLSWNGCN